MDSTPDLLSARWLGRQPFASCLERQLALRDSIVAGEEPQALLLVEHPPTVTLGRRATQQDLLWTPEKLEAAGIAVCETPRGGEATMHAPGQLVAYPIVRVGRQIRAHIVRMADATIELLGQLGVDGLEFRMEHPGVWRGAAKVASIGIHVSRGVAVQGISVNVAVDPPLFAALVSCGMPEVEMTSVAALSSGKVPSMPELGRAWAESYARLGGFDLDWNTDLVP